MSTNVKPTKKELLVRASGGECVICGYNRHVGALHFHHMIPAIKKFKVSSPPKGTTFLGVMDEVRKCALLCGNCHSEVHGGKIQNIGVYYLKQRLVHNGHEESLIKDAA